MDQPTRRSLLAGLAVAAATTADARAQSAAFPDRQVRYIVPFAPAGITDLMARLVAQKLAELWSRPVVVENRPGGAAMIGADVAAKAAPDGYTLLAITLTHAVNASLLPNPPYDLLRDFTAISILAEAPLVLVVNAARSPDRTLADLLARIRAGQPMNIGTPGNGSPPHLAMELIRRAAGPGANLTHVPYRGGAPVVTDLVAGNLDFAIPNLPECLGQVRGGQLRALAVTGGARHPLLADVPTGAEAGTPALRITNWTAMLVQAAVPAPIQARIAEATAAAMRDPGLVRRAEEVGFEALGWDPARSNAFLREEVARWAALVAEAGIKPDA